jgi:predicted lipid-binding transport protein (Tim44 family)
MDDDTRSGAGSPTPKPASGAAEYLNMGTSIALGTALGLVFGTMLGSLTWGLLMGAALGAVFGAVIEGERAKR